MAKRKRKQCPPPPKVKLRRAPKAKKRGRKASPVVDTATVFVLCASGPVGNKCRATAKSAGFTVGDAQSGAPKGIRDPKSGFTFKSSGTPCNAKRFDEKNPDKCPVQTVWRDGQLYMRVCAGKKELLGEVKLGRDPKKIRRAVQKACGHWRDNLSWDGYVLG